MKRLTLIIFLASASNFGLAQNRASRIEITPYIRTDWYPEFSHVMEQGSPDIHYIKIRGESWGINANYKIPIGKTLFGKIGLGYYRYSFNEMHNHSDLFGSNKSRIIGYPSSIYALFTTDKYWYNTVSINIGIEKWIYINDGIQIGGGVNASNYFSFSQYYHITANYPTGPPNHKYKLGDNRYFGFSINIHIDLLKKMGKIAIGPSFILPVFDLWKQDPIFPEETNSASRNKWFNAIGLGIAFNYLLKRNKCNETFIR